MPAARVGDGMNRLMTEEAKSKSPPLHNGASDTPLRPVVVVRS